MKIWISWIIGLILSFTTNVVFAATVVPVKATAAVLINAETLDAVLKDNFVDPLGSTATRLLSIGLMVVLYLGFWLVAPRYTLRFALVLMAVVLLGVGFVSVSSLPLDAVPDLTNVQVQVLTTSPALGPVEVEQFITFPVENAMSGLPGVSEIRSISRFGLSAVTVGIGRRLFDEMQPQWLRIGGYWYPRGGIPIDVFWQSGSPPEGLWLPDQGVAPYRGRG